MTDLIKRKINDNLTEVCLLDNDGLFKVVVIKDHPWEKYEKEFTYIGYAYDFFDWAIENE